MISVQTISEAFHEFLDVETNRLLCAFVAGMLVPLCMGLLVSPNRHIYILLAAYDPLCDLSTKFIR